MSEIGFTKMHGLGNDFVVIDRIGQSFNLTPAWVRQIADRHYGIGCDQLLVVEESDREDVDFRYRIFNADGTEAGQCGNGARCFAAFLRRQGMTKKDTISLETRTGLLRVKVDDCGLLTVDMGIPDCSPASIPFLADHEAAVYPIDVAGEEHSIGVVSMGNPHAVLRVDSVTAVDIHALGSQIESHPLFPERVNAGFMEVVDRHHIRLRVFERGTGETLACGSGACAAVVAGRRQGLLDERVVVELPGGNLTVSWSGPGRSVAMTGPATFVFTGSIPVPESGVV